MKYEEKRLSELVDTISDTRKIDKDKVVLVNTSDVLTGEVLNHTYTENCNLRGQFKKRFKTDDILYSEIRPANKRFAYIDFDSEDYIASTKLMVLRRKSNKITNRYLYYCLTNDLFVDRMQHLAEARSGTFPQITFDVLKGETIYLPSIANQNKITSILDNINNKIRLNNEINNNLYELSQKIYNRWFVDFEYPISSNQTYKSNGGSFKEVDGLVVPDNFIVNKLDEICDCQNGHAFYKEGYDDSGLMVIDLGNVSLQGNFIYTNADKYIDRNRIPNEKFIVKKNDLVMIMTDRKATMDLLGKTAKIYEDKEYALNQRIYRIRPTINVNYVYSFLNSSSTLEKLKGLALGSVQKYVNTNHINDLKIVVPSAEIMNEYSKVVDPVFKRMEENILENRNLEIMRDSLLPKLMNGEIDLDNIKI